MLVSVSKQKKPNKTSLSNSRHTKTNLHTLLESVSQPVALISESHNNDQRFSHLLEIMPAGVLVVDKNWIVSLANQQAISLMDEPLIGQAWRDLIAQVFTPKADDGHEVSMRNGKRVKIDISPLTQEKGQLIVITDLTETRQLQSRMGHMQRLSSLGKMVASLAHQVRTPLSSAMLYAENLKAMPLQNEMASRFSEKLTLRLKELESQVNDMLLFAKSSDKQIVAALTTKEIAEQSVEQVDAQLQQTNIALTFTNNIDQAEILGNATAIVGGITNLISNAMQALADSDQADPRILFSVEKTIKEGQAYAAFSVQDNGDGLAQSNVSNLFEPFYTTKSQGTGLGLAVVNTVAKSHKGFVKCGNNESRGAYFTLCLPINSVARAQPFNTQSHSKNNQTQDLSQKASRSAL
jgi:two-component system sensor histidine kinase FlrB